MRLRYKLRNKQTGEVIIEPKGYLLGSLGVVESIILPDGTQRSSEGVTFCPFLEEVDGQDIYDGDKAVVELTEIDENEDGDEVVTEVKKVTGTFKELVEEGLYWIEEEGSGHLINYMMKKPTIIERLNG